jgi:Uma2 family endonuclease
MKGVTVTSHPTAAPTSQEALESLLSDILPPQGAWSDDAYLWLTDHTNRPIELTDGHIQDLPMPTFIHQAILLFLYGLFHDHVTPRGGVVMVAALRMRIRPAKFREPDLLLLRDCDDPRGQNRYWMGADLVVEIVSPDNPGRDLVEKRIDYAEAGIPEYWIADPRDETITVLALREDTYVEHGVFVRGDTATSPLLEGFAVDVAAVFNAPPTGVRQAGAV